MKPIAIAGIVVLGLTASTAAMATDRLNVPRDQWLAPAEMTDRLSSQGYKVHEIEVDDGAYEVEMTDRNGVKLEAHVHPKTGDILLGYDD